MNLKKKKESACSMGDPGSVPESGRSPGEGNGHPPPTPVFLPRESPWTEESGGANSPWGRQESDSTE